MNKLDKIDTILENNKHIDKKQLLTGLELIDKLRQEGILTKPEYDIDPPTSAPPMIRVDYCGTRH